MAACEAKKLIRRGGRPATWSSKLKSRDRFTLINYDSDVETFRNELTEADKGTRADAQEIIDSMLAGGSTNIDEALSKALDLTGDADGPVYVVFMTDGQPTVGEKNTVRIAANVKQKLREGTRLFSLGVGHDVNSRLLDKLASICLGQTLYVRPGEPLDDVIRNLYDRIGAPALTDARLKITVDGKEGRTRQLYPSEMYDLFSGDQLVIVGRYRKHGSLRLELSGDYLGKRQKYVFEDELPERTDRSKHVFVERLWATRRIGQIIDEIDLDGENPELVDELIVLSKRHGILTPYTAYLAEEQTDLNDVAAGRRMTRSRLVELQAEAGESAFRQRSFKSGLKSADRVQSPLGASGTTRMAWDSASAPASTSPARPAIAATPISGGAPGSQMTEPARQADRVGAETVKRIASKTFFLRNGRYVDADATKQQIAGAEKIEQFSDAYFRLLDTLDEESKAYLAEDVEVVLVLAGKAYRITPARSE